MIAAVWYFAVEFKFEKEITKYMDEYYPYVCTCQQETDSLAKVLKATAGALVVMSGCSADAQKSANNNTALKSKWGQWTIMLIGFVNDLNWRRLILFSCLILSTLVRLGIISLILNT